MEEGDIYYLPLLKNIFTDLGDCGTMLQHAPDRRQDQENCTVVSIPHSVEHYVLLLDGNGCHTSVLTLL